MLGVCIVGGARAFHVTKHTLWTNAVEALQPDARRRHVVFETVPGGSDCGANPVNVQGDADFIRNCRSEAARSDRAMEAFARRRGAHVAMDKGLDSCAHPHVAGHPCCIGYPDAMKDPPTGVWGMAHYARKTRCAERLLEYEREHNVAFDFVVWLRPDLYFFEPMPPASYLQRVVDSTGPRVFLASKEHGESIADFLAVVPRRLVHRWLEATMDSVALACPAVALDGGFGHSTRSNRSVRLVTTTTPESRLEQVLNGEAFGLGSRSALPYQVLPFMFAVARSDQRADCARLDNELMARTSLVVADGDGGGDAPRRQRPAALCWKRFPQAAPEAPSGEVVQHRKALQAMPEPPPRRARRPPSPPAESPNA